MNKFHIKELSAIK